VSIAIAAVDVTNFVTTCDASKEAFKTATLLKTLNINALIMGEVGVGKRSLAQYILQDAPVLDALNHDELLVTLKSSSEVIITNLECSPNLNKIMQMVKDNGIRIIATAKTVFGDEFFSVKFTIPPLRERAEDVTSLIKRFSFEASTLFGGKKKFNTKNFKPNLDQNSKSLKRQIMMNYLLQDIKDIELIEIMQNYLVDKLGSNSDYRKFLYLYEVPLINAGFFRFKSQLQLADRLGLNRNTLRKKISDNKNYL